ncbi:MAG: Mur ligase domain-containing protein [Roseivirga sp.]
MKIHFISTGERIMHDLAIVLRQQGHIVTESDGSSLAPTARSAAHVSPASEKTAQQPQKITAGLDKVIVGRSIQSDSPELQTAQQLGLPIYSYPAYLHEYAQDKQRVVVIGGVQTSICVLVLHVLAYYNKEVDYIVDAPQLTTSVQLSEAPVILLEGDIAPSSPTDARPQCLRYQHHVALLSGTGGEPSKASPTLTNYGETLTTLADASPKGGTLIYDEEDPLIQPIGSQARTDVKHEPYRAHPYRQKDHLTYLTTPQGDVFLHNVDYLRAVAGAQQLLRNMAITDQQFYEALATFSGT